MNAPLGSMIKALALAVFMPGVLVFGEPPAAPTVPEPPGESPKSAQRARLITADDAARDDLMAVLPAAIDLGSVPIGDVRTRRVWVVNPSKTEPLRIEAVRFDCGCTTAPGFNAMALEPLEARPIDLRIEAPMEVGKVRDVRVLFVLNSGDAVFSTVHLETAALCDGFTLDPEPKDDGVLALPERLDLGDLTLGERHGFTVWLINPARLPVEIERLKTSCACLSAPGFEPEAINPGHAIRVDLKLRPETEPLDERRVHLYMLGTDGLASEMEIRYSAGKSPAGDGWETINEPGAPDS